MVAAFYTLAVAVVARYGRAEMIFVTSITSSACVRLLSLG